jgi:hypothetical protein
MHSISSEKSGESELVSRFVRRCRAAALLLTAVVTVAACGDETPGPAENRSPNPPTSSTPFAGTTIAPGEVVRVDNLDGARLQQVDDGIVRSFEVSVEVTEIGTADQLGSGDSGYRAGSGGTLLVFSMTTEHTERENPLEGDVVAAVAVDDKQRELPDFSSTEEDDDQTSYAVAVPRNRRSVTLDLKYSGVVQSFDLLEGEPTGERPDALYRADRGTVVFQEGLTPSQFDVDVSTQTYTNTVTVRRAELGYFPVLGHEMPSARDKAWLTMLVGLDAAGTTCAAPLSAYTFTADGTVYQPAQSASKISEPSLLDTPDAVVSFEVPADLSQGTLALAVAPHVTCQTSTATYNEVPARGTATIDVTLPKS